MALNTNSEEEICRGKSLILIGLGANLPSRYGTPAETLEHSKQALKRNNIKILEESCTWLSAPIPASDDPWYANAVISVQTDLLPLPLLALLHDIEAEFGRIRLYKDAPRVLDLDLLAHKSEIIDEKDIIVPHERMHERAFVLKPLFEIAPQWIHPKTEKNLSDLIDALDPSQNLTALNKGEEYRLAG